MVLFITEAQELFDEELQEVADKFVAVAKNPETETVELVFNLNETGALILQALQDGKDVTEIIDLLLAEYDIDIQDAEKEVNTFVDTLKNNGLIL